MEEVLNANFFNSHLGYLRIIIFSFLSCRSRGKGENLHFLIKLSEFKFQLFIYVLNQHLLTVHYVTAIVLSTKNGHFPIMLSETNEQSKQTLFQIKKTTRNKILYFHLELV